MIELKSVSKKYGSVSGTQALCDVDLTIGRGEIIGLFGENGAGKTTLLKCILGFLKYDGTITLDGEPVTKKNIARISLATCEHSFFPLLDAKAHREFYADHFGTFRAKRFDALMDFFALPRNKKLKAFSTGQQNQFEVVLALCQGADYILMDEPFAGNDIFNREDFYKVLLGILEPEETVLLSTHLIEEVEHFVGRAVLLRQGRILADRQSADLEEEGLDLMQFIRQSYAYEPARVRNLMAELEAEKDGE